MNLTNLKSLQAELLETWNTACTVEGVDPDGEVAVFSKDNVSAKRYFNLFANYSLSMYDHRKNGIYVNPKLIKES